MRWTAAVLAVVALAAASGCSDDEETPSGTATESTTEASTATGIPADWYTAVDDAIAEQPEAGSAALLDARQACPLRDEAILDGEDAGDAFGAGVVRLGGLFPAVVCQWFDDTPVQIIVARAEDDAAFDALVDATGAREERGNEQTEERVTVGAREFLVVRKHYPTNPAAGTDLTAHYFDEDGLGRISLEVAGADDLDGYDERSVAEDLAAFLDS